MLATMRLLTALWTSAKRGLPTMGRLLPALGWLSLRWLAGLLSRAGLLGIPALLMCRRGLLGAERLLA